MGGARAPLAPPAMAHTPRRPLLALLACAQCPCFCSERSSDFSPYWDAAWGPAVPFPTCATQCFDASVADEELSFCRGIVNYRFCATQLELNQVVPDERALLREYDGACVWWL